MTSHRTLRLAAAGLLAAGTFAASEALAINETNMSVSATVTAACTFTANALAFGEYQTNRPTDLDAETSITYQNCANGTYAISIGEGIHTTGGYNRRMENGSSFLQYNIYTDSARTDVWTTIQHPVSTPTGSVPVYGRIPGSQPAPLGSYSDTLLVTVTLL